MTRTVHADGSHSAVSLPALSPNKSVVAPRQEDLAEDLPPVFQFPVIATVQATFREAGRHQPLPFPEEDD
jgi:hypothetical protein